MTRKIIVPTTLDSDSKDKILELQKRILDSLLMKAAVETLNKTDVEQLKTCLIIEKELKSKSEDSPSENIFDTESTDNLLKLISNDKP